MLRPLRALVAALALTAVLPLGSPAAAEGGATPPALANEQRRQELLYRRWPDDGVPGTVILTTSTPAAAGEVAAREDGQVIGHRSVLLHVEPGTEAATAARVAARGGVLDAEPDRVRQPGRTPNDPGYVTGDQWSHTITNAPAAWDTTVGDAGVVVAVLDTGVDGDHPDLVDNIIEQVDLSAGTPRIWVSRRDNDTCDVGHGTFVAGVLGATGDNAEGVAGVAWDVSIVDVALSSRASRCGILDSAIIAGLDYVSRSRAGGPVDIVNLSLGGIADACTTAMQAAIDDARDAGTLIVASSGNENELLPGATSIPASCAGVVSVGAVGQGGAIAPYSNENPHVDIAAPGGDSATGRGIVSTAPGGGYGEIEGTSFASPYVAGIAALLRSVDPSLTADDLESILESTASDRGLPGRDPQYGWGLVDASRAVQAAVAGDPPTPADDPPFPVKAGALFVERVSAAGTTTKPVAQAVAMSKFTFVEPESAMHVVLARSDDFADALAGSSLAFGVGPLLFAHPTGALPGVTRIELQRVLAPGGTVYLLGGSAALPPSLEGELRDLGYEPVRLAGASRIETAVAVADALRSFLSEEGFFVPAQAIVTTGFNWPDAVAAGAIGAWFGVPVLVTPPTELSAPVADFLGRSDLDEVFVVGGTAAVAESVRTEIREATGLASGAVKRLAGVDRSGTAVAVAEEFERLFGDVFEAAFGEPEVPNIVAGVNLRRADGFAHVLSASALIGAGGGVFVPIEGEGGDEIEEDAQRYACRFPAFGVVVGGDDLVDDDTVELLDELMRGSAPICTS